MSSPKINLRRLGREVLTLDALIDRLLRVREEVDGSVTVTMLMEPEVGGEVVQLEDPVCDVAYTSSGVHVLGRSFD